MKRGLRHALSAAAIAGLLLVLGLVFIAWRDGGMAGVFLGMTMSVC